MQWYGYFLVKPSAEKLCVCLALVVNHIILVRAWWQNIELLVKACLEASSLVWYPPWPHPYCDFTLRCGEEKLRLIFSSCSQWKKMSFLQSWALFFQRNKSRGRCWHVFCGSSVLTRAIYAMCGGDYGVPGVGSCSVEEDWEEEEEQEEEKRLKE